MGTLKQKTKDWYANNKDVIEKETVKFIWYGFGFVLGAFTYTKVNNAQIERGLRRIHDEGLMKFFDITTGAEISFNEAAKVISTMSKNK